jgi:hypothetical protein
MTTSPRSWKVVTNAPGARRAASIVLTDERYAPLRAFFFAIPDEQCVRLIQSALDDVGLGYEEVGVTFPADLDPGDEPLRQNEVEIYDPMTEIRMPRQEFLEVLLKVAEVVLAAREGNADPDLHSVRELSSAVARLQKRVTASEE